MHKNDPTGESDLHKSRLKVAEFCQAYKAGDMVFPLPVPEGLTGYTLMVCTWASKGFCKRYANGQNNTAWEDCPMKSQRIWVELKDKE